MTYFELTFVYVVVIQIQSFVYLISPAPLVEENIFDPLKSPGTIVRISSVQLLIHVRFFATPWTAALQASLSITNSWSLLRLMSIMSMMPSNHLILYRPLLPPSVCPSIRVLSNESVLCVRWPKYWNFSFSISPSNDIQG